jgi:molybdenum cofactor guanylyltransferase
MAETTLCGLVLAGGKSSRMGKDKSQCILGGRRLIDYSIDVLKHFTERIVISSNSLNPADFDYPVFRDEVQDIGPLGGIYSAMKLFDCDYYLVVSCDMPLIHMDVLTELIKRKEDGLAVVPVYRNKIEPLCAIYSKQLLNSIDFNIQLGRYAVRTIANENELVIVDISDVLESIDYSPFTNINSAEELHKAEELISLKN